MRITVAICTWNRCKLLKQTLEQMTRLVVPQDLEWELLIVNNNSSDATADVCAVFSSRLPIRSTFEAKPGLCNARNCALSEALGDFILFVDDDALVDPGWLRVFAEAASRYPSAAVFGGPVEPWFPVKPDPDLIQAFPFLGIGFCGVDHRRPEGPLPPELLVFGANMAFSMRHVQDIQFDSKLGVVQDKGGVGEETLFIERIRAGGGTVIWVPRMRIKHFVDPSRMTLAYLLTYYSGRGRTWIRLTGMPDGPRVFGVPRWLLRSCVEEYVLYLFHRVAGWRRSCSVSALEHLRDHHRLRGMITESLALGSEKSSVCS